MGTYTRMQFKSFNTNNKQNILNDETFVNLLKSKFKLKHPSILRKVKSTNKTIELLETIENSIK